jgi:hypothetical protein
LANDYNETKQTPQSAAMFTSTQITIVFTIIIMGAITTPLVRRLRIPTGVDYDRMSKFEIVEETNKVTGFDRKYIKPFFTKKVYKPRETGMQLETFEDKRKEKSLLVGLDEENNNNNNNNNNENNKNVNDLEAADKLAAAREILKDFEPMKNENSQTNNPSRRKW